jgi:hypothetical protein
MKQFYKLLILLNKYFELLRINSIAKENECTLIHLETMDFQAKDFYIKSGYEICGELVNVPTGHKRYYMRKILMKGRKDEKI